MTNKPTEQFRWCAPGDDQQDTWIVRFNDPDMREAIYRGDDAEKDAREKWNAWCGPGGNWNGHLFRLALRSSTPQEPDDDALIAVVRDVLYRRFPTEVHADLLRCAAREIVDRLQAKAKPIPA